MILRLLPLWSVLLLGGALGYSTAGLFRGETPVEPPDRRERQFVERWAELDPAGAADWAASLGSPMARDAALREIYRTWSEADPVGAASSIGGLPAGSARTVAATADVVRTWRRADTAAANAFVQASPVLPPELKQPVAVTARGGRPDGDWPCVAPPDVLGI